MTATAPSKETILVVDDEASIRRILETRLSMIGYNVVTACDGTEALELFENTAPDLVVLDVMMPKLDGYGVCQELRKESDVPIVMLPAFGDVPDGITGLELGADDYVVKPFSPKELEARIRCVEDDGLNRRTHWRLFVTATLGRVLVPSGWGPSAGAPCPAVTATTTSSTRASR